MNRSAVVLFACLSLLLLAMRPVDDDPSFRHAPARSLASFSIDPRLSPQLDRALVRLSRCAPEPYTWLDQNILSFSVSPTRISRTLWEYRDIALSTDFLDPAPTEFLEMAFLVNLAHESRHAWQFSEALRLGHLTPLILDLVGRERDAYGYSLSIFDTCPPSDPAGIPELHARIAAFAVNPP